MKILKNKETDIPKTQDGEGKTLYSDLISMCVQQPKQNGFRVAGIRDRVRVLDAIEKVKKNGKIKIEDADAKTLQMCVKNMNWGIVHKDIVSFADDIKNL